MKRIAAVLLAAISLCLVCPACGTSVPDEGVIKPGRTPLPEGFEITEITFPPFSSSTSDPISDASDIIAPEYLLFAESFISGGGNAERTTWKTYKDHESFTKAFPNLPESLSGLKKEDFDSMIVIAVSDVVRTGGYTFTLGSLEISDGVIHIDCKKVPPPKGSMVTMAFQTHTLLVGIKSSAVEPGMITQVTVNGSAANALDIK